jgi:pyruvate/2-oxoacid:ferredoxin oxidoreductase alpha subunit
MINGSINNPNTKVDFTVRVFDQFYEFDIEVDANEFDVVNSYFGSVFNSKPIAKNFTTTLFRIANETRVPVLTLLDEIRGLDNIALTATLAYYINGMRSPSTLLGVNEPVTPNFYTARNVLP